MRKHIEVNQVCPICGKSIVSKRSLNRHKQTHFAPKFVCKVCGRGFHVASKLKVSVLF